jgi:hypothetical protein
MAARNKLKILVPEQPPHPPKKEMKTGFHYDLVVTGNEQRIHMRREEK